MELDFWMVVSWEVWGLGTELQSKVLDHWVISLVPAIGFCILLSHPGIWAVTAGFHPICGAACRDGFILAV